MDNRLSIHFGDDKTKWIHFANKQRLKNVRQLNIRYQHINIKQHLQITYLGCLLGETISGESMALKTVNKFLYHKKRYLTKDALIH